MLIGTGEKYAQVKAERDAARAELERTNARLDEAERVIEAISSSVESLSYCAPEARTAKLEQLAEVSRRLITSHRENAAHGVVGLFGADREAA